MQPLHHFDATSCRCRDSRLRLSAADPADAVAMRALVRAAYQPYVSRIGREPAPMVADYDSIAASGRALLAKLGDELVALLVTGLEDGALLVENLAVLPRMQGSGIGTLLLQEAERLARDAGASEIRLYTNEAMTENIAFYGRQKFRETHRSEQDGFRRVFFVRAVPAGR